MTTLQTSFFIVACFGSDYLPQYYILIMPNSYIFLLSTFGVFFNEFIYIKKKVKDKFFCLVTMDVSIEIFDITPRTLDIYTCAGM